MRILFVTAYPPAPPRYGGAARVLALLSRLARRHEVHLLTFVDGEPDEAQREALESICETVGFVRQPMPRPAARRPLYLARTMAGRTPPYIAVFDSPAMRERIRERLAAGIDIVQLEWTQMAQYCLAEAADRTVLTEHDIFWRSLASYEAAAPPGPAKAIRGRRAAQMRAWELEALSRVAGVFTVSDADRDELREDLPGTRVETVPSGADMAYYSLDESAPAMADERCPRFVLVGGLAHEPNLDALSWLAGEVMGRIRATLPDATVDVIGGDASAAARRYEGNGIRLLGFVEDTRPFLAGAISLAPIRIGGGVRMKVIEAMAAGSPVVATSLGASGLGLADGEQALIADGADDFARAAVSLAEDRETRRRLARNARAFAETHHDWDRIAALQESLYARWFGGVHPAGGRPAS
jgi:glycosyltransferase involved in cell wall biosynthesis